MDLIIGRDGQTSQLNVAVGKKIYRFFPAGSVPQNVSRQHCIVTMTEDGKYIIRNIKANNVTYVNGIEIEKKEITDADRIEIGRSRYLVDLSYIIGKLLPQQQKNEVDISHLQTVWEDYNAQDLKLQKHQKNIGLLASVPMGFTMLGGLVSGLSETIRPYAMIFTAIALAIMIYGFYKRYTDDTLEKRNTLKLQFQQQYVCPNTKCNHFMGFNPFVSIYKRGACPYCQTPYKKIEHMQS